MRKGRNGILVLVLLLAVGFAAVTTTLVINGTTLFGTNSSEFDVIFTKAIVDGEDKSDTAIVEDGTKIIYTTKELAIVDETSLLEFTVKNNSTQYDAEVSIECSGGSNAGTYYEIEKNVATRIVAQTEEEGTVIVKMIKSSVNEIEEEFTCTITATAVERDTAAEYVCRPKMTCNEEGNVCWEDTDCGDDKSIGDVVSLGTEENSIEQFYILKADEENIQMMSMYNLYVGGEASNETGEWVNTPYTNSTGIQDSTMIGYKVGEKARRGVTVFSSDEQKGVNFSDYLGSIVEGYVNNYSAYLSNTLGVQNTATLIRKEELEAVKGDGSTLKSANNLSTLGYPSFLYSTSYWTRSADNIYNVWVINSDGGFYSGDCGNDAYSGVRPVVTISADLLN